MARILSAQTLSIVCLLAIAVVASSSRTRKNQGNEDFSLQKRNAKDDQHSSETGHHHHHGHHHGGGGGGGTDHSRGAKYFMYAHQPGKKHYEFGYKRGNDHHTIERYEKLGPKHNFKTKVRWHDAHGGHGEMYWDYNHGPKHHGGDDGHHHGGHYHHGSGHGGHHGYGHGQGYHSEPVPSIVEAESSTSLRRSPKERHYANSDIGRSSKFLKRSGIEKKANEILKKSYSKKLRSKNALKESTPVVEEKDVPSVFPDVLGFDPYVPPAIAESKKLSPESRNRGSAASSQSMPKKNSERRGKSNSKPKSGVIPKLAYDLDTGRVYDENTDTWFDLVRL